MVELGENANGRTSWPGTAEFLAGNLALAAIYLVAGRLGLLFPITHDHVTLLWAPTGIALAAVLQFGLRAIPESLSAPSW